MRVRCGSLVVPSTTCGGGARNLRLRSCCLALRRAVGLLVDCEDF